MRKSFFVLSAFILLTGTAFTSDAQKKVLDHDVYDSWKRVQSGSVSADGSILSYEIVPQEGDGTLYLRRLSDGKELAVERGGSLSVSHDGKWAVCKIKAPYEATRKARIAKKSKDKMPKDTLACINLTDFSVLKAGTFSSYKASVEGTPLLAYETEVTEKPDTASKKKPGKVKVLVVANPSAGSFDTLRHVKGYQFDKYGKRLAVVFSKDKKDSLSKDEVALYLTDGMERHSLAEGARYYSTPKFNRDGSLLLFLASSDSAKSGGKHCALYMAEDRIVGKGKRAVRSISAQELIPSGYTDGLPAGLCVTEHSNPRFSVANDRIFLGIAECEAPKDTAIIDFETAKLDIWNWDVYMTPPMQKVNAGKIKSATCAAVIDLKKDPHRIVPLSSALEETVTPVCGGEADWALVKDERPYQISGTWDGNELCDVYIASLADGSRKTVFKGLNGKPGVSPCGKYLTWYDYGDLCWHSYNVATGQIVNLTQGLDGTFHNDEDDHPMPDPPFDSPHWLEGDEAFLLADKFDIWKITPDGRKAENMTCGQGRAANVEYRYTGLVPQDITGDERSVGHRIPIGRKETVYLTVFDRNTKEHGIATISAAKPGIVSERKEPYSFSGISHAFKAPVVAYTKGDFTHPMDLYVTRDYWASEEKVTDLKPQQDEYNWGNVQLVHWNAYDGTPMDGLLYTPEDLDPTGKYPMIIYFYEKMSQELFTYYNPVPSRSIINIPFYVSRGYVVFVPDIRYKDGHPGESAYNCICSGAEAMCSRFGFIDKGRMGIQGQSWGGYQTAYLVTRTNMFAAAGSGAPVGNMTSAYGGIRWGSGVVRAVQYEHGQSRIGKSMWEEGGLGLYIENSPVFHTQGVTTPVLIMANDNDGAVPWYQGIEFFMSLRRFGKPSWLLQYNGEAHNLVQRRNCKDLSRRLQQFFDHYLKGDPMPAWMKNGVPYARKGQYFGFEAADGEERE